MAYVEGGVSILSRVRSWIGPGHERRPDAALSALLASTAASGPRLRLWLPTGTDAATAASVTLALTGTAPAETLVLTLSRTIGSPATQTITIQAGWVIRDLVDAIAALELGWSASIYQDGREEEISMGTECWTSALKFTGAVVEFGNALNLKPISATSAYGDYTDAAELRVYSPGRVVLEALREEGGSEQRLAMARNLVHKGIAA